MVIYSAQERLKERLVKLIVKCEVVQGGGALVDHMML